MAGRVDLEQNRSALSLCLNFVPTLQGPLTRRPGTRYIANTKNNGVVRLQEFVFSNDQAYTLEFGDRYVRFYIHGGQLLNSDGTPYEVTTNYPIADVEDLCFTQSNDTIYITHRSYTPMKLQRYGATDWRVSPVVFVDGPYIALNITDTTLSASGTQPSIAVTASAATGINGGVGFRSSDVGRNIRMRGASDWLALKITSVNSPTSVTATIEGNHATGGVEYPSTTTWRLGAWNATDGWPSCCAFHQQRLVLANSASIPDTIWASNTTDYENFAPSEKDGTITSSNAYTFALSSGSVNNILWLASSYYGLVCGTESSIWVVAASTLQDAITPTNVSANPTIKSGSARVTPVMVDKEVMFIELTNRALLSVGYQYVYNEYPTTPVSVRAAHLIEGGVKKMVYQPQPNPVIWLVCRDGSLISATYSKDQQVNGWARHQLGGYSDDAETLPPIVESIACIPSGGQSRYDVYLSVQRRINGATVRTVEVLTDYWRDGSGVESSFYADCGATYEGSATTEITGLNWLIGQNVSVLTDGSAHPSMTVDNNGSIALSWNASKVTVGLPYQSVARTLPVSITGVAISAKKRINKALFRLYDTVGLQTLDSGYSQSFVVPFRQLGGALDSPVLPYTGDKVTEWGGDFGHSVYVEWAQTVPLPCNIVLLEAEVSIDGNAQAR